jgi:hypothetical protein
MLPSDDLECLRAIPCGQDAVSVAAQEPCEEARVRLDVVDDEDGADRNVGMFAADRRVE